MTGKIQGNHEIQEPRVSGGLPRVLTGFMLAFFAGTVLCLIAAMVLLTLDLPWSDPVLAELKRLVMVLMLGTVVFKAAVQLYKR